MSLNSFKNVRNLCCRSLSPYIWISDKTSVVDGEGNHGLNVSVLSWSISSSSVAEPPRMFWASIVSEASKLHMTGFRGFATGVKRTFGGQSHSPVIHLDGKLGLWARSLPPSWLGTLVKRLNFFIASLPIIKSTGVYLRMCTLMSKVSYLLLLSSISNNDYLTLNILCS